MSSAVLIRKIEHGITVISINRPEQRNAVDGPTAKLLSEAIRTFENDSTSPVAILTGSSTIFCAGADLASVATGVNMTALNDVDQVEEGKQGVNGSLGPMGPSRFMTKKPVIAAVEGYAVAGGLELALWCDMRVASENAIFGVFCRRWGVPLIDGGTVRLPRLIGLSRALDLILTGRPVDASEALSIGLVTRVVSPGTALAAAITVASQIASFPQKCMLTDRASAYESQHLDLPHALKYEYDTSRETLETETVAGAKRFKLEKQGRHGSFQQFQSPPSSSSTFSTSSTPSLRSPASAPSVPIRAIFFDLGGVVLGSPIHAIIRIEESLGLPQYALNRWLSRSPSFEALECGRVSLERILPEMQRECEAVGINGCDVKQVFQQMEQAASTPRTNMIRAIQELRQQGFMVAAITNNWKNTDGEVRGTGMSTLDPYFDFLIESCVIHHRKPDRIIFQRALDRARVKPEQCVFLDDIGRNVKAARAMGLQTIHVNDPTNALKQLQQITGVNLKLDSDTSISTITAKL